MEMVVVVVVGLIGVEEAINLVEVEDGEEEVEMVVYGEVAVVEVEMVVIMVEAEVDLEEALLHGEVMEVIMVVVEVLLLVQTMELVDNILVAMELFFKVDLEVMDLIVVITQKEEFQLLVIILYLKILNMVCIYGEVDIMGAIRAMVVVVEEEDMEVMELEGMIVDSQKNGGDMEEVEEDMEDLLLIIMAVVVDLEEMDYQVEEDMVKVLMEF